MLTVRTLESVCCVLKHDTILIASVNSAVKLVPAGDNLMNGAQCYELFRGIAHTNHAFFR